jgi:nicotinate-nucleotide adenylyltransferase
MAELTGVFGGTFDPPHLGHLILAEEARAALNLERVLWVVTGVPPHKPDRPISPLEQRLVMVRLAIGLNTTFEISRADIDRDPPHFAHGTLSWLQDKNPDTNFCYILGSDSLLDLPEWDQPERLIDLSECIAVMLRPGADVDFDPLFRRFPGLEAKLRILDVPLFDVSGQVIRERVRSGGAFRYFIPEPVYTYIEKHELYR